MHGPFLTENCSLMSSQSFLAVSKYVIVNHSAGLIVFNIHETNMELTVRQSSCSNDS